MATFISFSLGAFPCNLPPHTHLLGTLASTFTFHRQHHLAHMAGAGLPSLGPLNSCNQG